MRLVSSLLAAAAFLVATASATRPSFLQPVRSLELDCTSYPVHTVDTSIVATGGFSQGAKVTAFLESIRNSSGNHCRPEEDRSFASCKQAYGFVKPPAGASCGIDQPK